MLAGVSQLGVSQLGAIRWWTAVADGIAADGSFLPAAGMVPNHPLFRAHGQPLTTRCVRCTTDRLIQKPDIQSPRTTAMPLHPNSALYGSRGAIHPEHCSDRSGGNHKKTTFFACYIDVERPQRQH